MILYHGSTVDIPRGARRVFFLPKSCIIRKKAVPLQPQRLETRKNENL
jgi:hypothetical protein